MEVTVAIDGDEYTTKLPPVMVREFQLAVEVYHRMGEKAGRPEKLGPAEIFCRLCTLGVDAWLKVYGYERFKFVTAQLKEYLERW